MEKTMRKLILAFLATVAVSTATPTYANNDWVAPLIGGVILGGVLNQMNHQPRYQQNYYYGQQQYYAAPQPYYDPYYYQPVCNRYFAGRDIYGRPVFQTVCQ